MQDLKISIIQSHLHWENIEENLKMFSDKITGIKGPSDLIVLPEMFSTGFTMNNKGLAEKMNGRTFAWLQEKAKEKDCAITGSFIVEESGNYYNRLIWMRADGTYETYDKRHLFRYAKEQEYYTAGTKKLIVELKGWKICPMICYDLRFPVWIRNINKSQFDYDVLLFVANWPERRNHPWKTLLQARAMENQAYVIGVNRVGKDGNDFTYSGDSVVLDFMGEPLSELKAHEDASETIMLSAASLKDWRSKFPAWMDADSFDING